MTKRSRTNIQVSENRSNKRIRQYGGAAIAPMVNTKHVATTKQIFKGDALEKLNELLDLGSFSFEDSKYKFKFKQTTIPEIQKKLEPGIKNLQDAIVELGKQLSSHNISSILQFKLDDHKNLLPDKLQQIKLKLEYLDTKAIIDKIAKEVLKRQSTDPLLNKLDTSFQQSAAFRNQVKALFNNVNNIPINLFVLTPSAINTGWSKITNHGEGESSHISSNESILSSADKIDILVNGNVEQINRYFIECEKLQVYYNQKHNEIINLYNILRGIITIKLTLVQLILEILRILQINITRRGTETTTTIYEPDYEPDDDYSNNNDEPRDRHRPQIMIRKPNFEGIQDKLRQQQILLEAARRLLPHQQAEGTQLGGAAGAAVPNVAQNQMQISNLSGSNNDEFTITYLDPNKIKPGQNIMITIPGSQEALLARFLGTSTEQPTKFKFKLIQGKDVFANIKLQFNNAQLEDQKIYIDFIDYVIPDVETMQVITALKQIAIVEKTLLTRQQSRMKPEGELSKITKYANINSYETNAATLQRDSVEFTQDNTDTETEGKKRQIERVILNCYDLQNLYLIKHLEFINLFKMILYFSDMYMVNISIFNYIILLFQTDTLAYKYIDNQQTIPGRRQPKHDREPQVEPYQTKVNLPKVLIESLPVLLQQQARATTSMIPSQSQQNNTQVGGAAAAANVVPEQSLESIFQEKIKPLIGDITYNYANLHELENKISRELLNQYNANLFKAWLLVRIERLTRLLAQPKTRQELKPKIEEMIKEYTSIAEEASDSLDISAYINKYSVLISSDYVLGKIKEEIELLPETASTRALGEEQNDENQNVIAAKQDLLETLKNYGVCALGNKAACESDYNKSLALLKSTLINMEFAGDDVNQIITLDGTIDDKFAVNQIALYLLKKVSFEDMIEKVNTEITESQSKTNITKIIKRILQIKEEINQRRVKEEDARRRAAEEARKNPTYGKLKQESDYFKLKPVIQIMSAFNIKTEEQKTKILADIKNSHQKIADVFAIFSNIYDQLDKKRYPDGDENTKFLDDMKHQDEAELAKEKYEDYLAFIKQCVTRLSELVNITEILANLLEIINGAARTIIRIKPIEHGNDNQVPLVAKDESERYTVKDYIKSLPEQKGGYNYTDIINVSHEDNLKLQIGAYCSGEILPEKKAGDYSYGPFSAVYPPQYNNFDIYANLFGVQTIQEILTKTPIDISHRNISGILNRELNSKKHDATREFGSVNNPDQGLMAKLANGGSVVIFGYGFSGSGKTYALIEGSKEFSDGNYKYDPSILEQFIKSNSDVIESVEFMELYPLGIDPNGVTKIITQEKEPIKKIRISGRDESYNEYVMYAEELGESIVNPMAVTDLYAPIQKEGINYQAISYRIKLLERHRIHKLRILATPNNDNSSRSFLQITLNIDNPSEPIKKGKLVFFDMPGTENTVRIKAEFMGSDIFASIIGKYKSGETYYMKQDRSVNAIPNSQQSTENLGQILNDSGNVFPKNPLHYGPSSLLKNIHTAQKLKVNYYEAPGVLKIFAIQAKQIFEKPTQEDRANEDMAFKYNLTSYTTFSTFGITIKDKLLGEVGREMAFFFNGIDCNSIYETTSPIIFFSNEDHKNIFTTFMAFFNKKDGVAPIFYSKDNTGKCKISAVLDENDRTNLANIFRLKQNEAHADEQTDDYFGISGRLDNLNSDGYYSLDDIMNFKPSLKQPATKTSKTSVAKSQPVDKLKEIYFYNPLIKYLYLLINFAYHTKFSTKDKILELDKTHFYIVCNFFIYKFIKFIVEQGRNIITTLEHLKFFFLSRVDGITNYNQDALRKAGQEAKGNKAFLFNNSNAALEQEKTYVISMKYGTKDKPIKIEEKVNLGQFKKFQLLSMLQDLAGNQSDLSSLDEVTTEKGAYPNLMTPLGQGAGVNKFGAIFVMFANIKAYIRDPATYELTNEDDALKKELPKLCTAEFDTLEFAESISSTTYNKKNLATLDVGVGAGAGAAAAKNGGGMHKVKYRNKKGNMYYLSTKHRSTLKKSLASKQHSIYSRRSKKYSGYSR